MKPRVLHLLGNLYTTGGSERQAAQLAQMLHQSSRFEVFVACLDPSGNWGEELKKIGITNVPSFKFYSFFSFTFLQKLVRFVVYLRKQKIDIVHTHDFYTNVFGMIGSWLAGIKGRIASKRETDGLRTKAQRFVENQSYRLANRIVVNGEAVQKHLVEAGINQDKIVKVFNGLNLDRVTHQLDIDEVQQLLNLPLAKGHRYVTILANLLYPVKDHPTFLRAAQITRQAVSDARFVIAGEGPLKEEMVALSRGLGLDSDVYFLGPCRNVAELLSVSEVCVLSSKSEGFSNAILEYMGAGRPVVATNVGGASEVIIEGRTGYLVESGDYETMAARIIDLLKNPDRAKEMGQSGRQIVQQKFSCEAQLEGTERLYERLLAKKNQRGIRQIEVESD